MLRPLLLLLLPQHDAVLVRPHLVLVSPQHRDLLRGDRVPQPHSGVKRAWKCAMGAVLVHLLGHRPCALGEIDERTTVEGLHTTDDRGDPSISGPSWQL
jgi:hypothetical protein